MTNVNNENVDELYCEVLNLIARQRKYKDKSDEFLLESFKGIVQRTLEFGYNFKLNDPVISQNLQFMRLGDFTYDDKYRKTMLDIKSSKDINDINKNMAIYFTYLQRIKEYHHELAYIIRDMLYTMSQRKNRGEVNAE